MKRSIMRRRLAILLSNDLYYRRKHGKYNYSQNNVGKIILNHRQSPEEISDKKERTYPQDSAGNIVKGKAGIAHRTDTSHEGRKGSDDRDKPGVDNGLPPVLEIESLGFFQVLFFQKFILTAEGFGTYILPNMIVDQITDNGGDDQKNTHQKNIKSALGLRDDSAGSE